VDVAEDSRLQGHEDLHRGACDEVKFKECSLPVIISVSSLSFNIGSFVVHQCVF